jgi:hypothetical protein
MRDPNICIGYNKTFIITLLLILFTGFSGFTQEKSKTNFFKEVYKDFLKYGTIYAAGDLKNAYEPSRKEFFVRPPEDGNLYDVPEVIEVTDYYDFDYRYGFGIRKLARFDYERKPKNFYDGTENQLAFSAPSSAIKGLEYQFHWEKERERDEVFKNHRMFIKWTGKYHIIKAESREIGKLDLAYQSGEVRARLPIGKKFSISAGAIYRTHERGYGYNPVEVWLNELDENGNIVNYWYTLGYEYGYTDHFTTYTDAGTGNSIYDWIWRDSNGDIAAYSDIDFRNTVFADLMNRYNNEFWDERSGFGVVSPVIGFDLYHYKSKFWLHLYANWLLPYHQYVKTDPDWKELHYGNRNNWGQGGLVEDAEFEQWDDYSAGISFGWKIAKNLGVFFEGEYTKYWDTELFNSTAGLNFTFR